MRAIQMDNAAVTYRGRDEVGMGGVDEAVLVMRFSGPQGYMDEAYGLSELAAVGVNVGKTVVVTVVVALNNSVTLSFNPKKWKLTIKEAERRSRYC